MFKHFISFGYRNTRIEENQKKSMRLTLELFPVQNTEILRALQKASGLSPDDEPIKLLSVPKGALGNECLNQLFNVVLPREFHQIWHNHSLGVEDKLIGGQRSL